MPSHEESCPLLTEPEVTVSSLSHNVNSTNLDCVDWENPTSSITSVSPNNPRSASPSLVSHPSYEVLIGGRRPQLKTMPYRNQLLAQMLELDRASFLPSLMKEEPNIKACYATNTAFSKQSRK